MEPIEQADNQAQGIKESEQRDVEERTAPRALVVYETIRREGVDELNRPPTALAWSGLAAGLSMGFSLVAEGLLRSALPDTPMRPLIAKFGYSFGFLIAILGRQQLFTENTLTPILPLLQRRTISTLLRVVRLWAIVFAANLLGALIFALVIGHTAVFEAPIRQTFTEMGLEAINNPFWTTMIRAIFAGWLIALMVWLLPFAESARVWVIILITYLVGLGRFSHIVAGSIETLYVVTTGSASWSAFFGYFLIPTLIGNVLGGVSLVAALNHAQVVAGSVKD
ncbi:MAG: formate/nitrite transporter family protein [Herpetosiphon sp.]